MPFSSRRSGGNSHLPYSVTNRPPRKTRRRPLLRDLILSNIFTLSIILLIFLLFLLLHFRQGPLRAPRSRPLRARSSGALVDITTKDLYDKIDFVDEDGGPWKQGWRVTYKGNEWDQEKLKVFVVPHSHNDPGWLLTVEEYYQMRSKHILDTIVESLSKVVLHYLIM